MTITINLDNLPEITERLNHWEMLLDHPEYTASEEERKEILGQWRGARYALRKLGIKL